MLRNFSVAKTIAKFDAVTVKVQRVMFDIKFQDIAHHALDLLNTRVAKLHHFTAINADYMIVLFIAVRFFKLRHVFAKLVFGYQIARNQKLQGVVNRSTTNAVLLVFHVDV